MTNFTDPLGVFTEKEYLNEDGFETVMPGEASRRALDLPRYASTSAEITFDNEEDLQRFLAVMEETDRRLASISDEQMRNDPGQGYDWQKVLRKGLTIKFGVMWYKKDFFENRKDAYKSEMHASVLKQFNITPSDLKIKHTIL